MFSTVLLVWQITTFGCFQQFISRKNVIFSASSNLPNIRIITIELRCQTSESTKVENSDLHRSSKYFN